MAENQRIHPVVVVPPTRPPQGQFPSVKMDPSGRNAPVVRRTNCCCKCLCWIITTLILLLIIVAASLAILYFAFQPKLPKYSVDNLRITDLTLNFDLTLCQGSIPRFYQGHQNTTVLDVGLTGQNQYGTTLLEALQEQQQTGRIPLDLKIDVPVRIKLGKLKLMKVRILGRCKLIVDSLSTNKLISIKASSCNFGLKP